MPGSDNWRCNHPPEEFITHRCCIACPRCGARVKIGFEEAHSKNCQSKPTQTKSDWLEPKYPPTPLCERDENDGAV